MSGQQTGILVAVPTSFYWTNSVSGNWSVTNNWTNDLGWIAAPVTAGQTNYTLNFNNAGTYTASNNLDSGFLLNQLNFGGATATLAGYSLAFTNNGVALPQINQNSAAAITIGNNLVLGADTTFGGSGTGTVAGAMSGAGGLTKTGSGTLLIGSTNNTYSGATVISGGTLKLQGVTVGPAGLWEGSLSGSADFASAIPHTSIQLSARMGATSSGWVNNTTWGYTGYFYAATAGTYTFGKAFDDSGFLKIDGATILNDSTWSSAVTATANLSVGWHTIDLRFGQGTGGVGPQGNYGSFGIGYQTPGSSTWRQISDPGNASVLSVQVDGNGNSGSIPDTTPLSIAAAATFDLGGFSQTIASLSDSGGGGGVVTNSSSSATLTINPSSGSTTFSGAIRGPISLVKTGIATQVLAGTSAYTGGTTVSNGTLLVNGSITGSVNVISGATLGGTGSITGNVTYVTGALALFTDDDPLTFTGTVTLNSNVVHLTLPVGLEDGTYLLATNTTGSFSGSFAATPVIDSGSTVSTNRNIVMDGSAVRLVLSSSPILLSPFSLPSGIRYAGYSQQITAGGGTAPYTYANVAGTLPSGLTLSSGGLLSGTPDTAGTYNFTVQATDDASVTGSNAFTVVIQTAATSFFWTNPASGGWDIAGNWTNDLGSVAAPANAGQSFYTLNFNEAGATYTATNNLNNGFLLNRLNFGGANATLAGNSVTLTNSGATLPQVNQNGAAAVTVSNNIALGANTTLGGSGAGTVTVAGVISGAGSLTMTNAGTLTLRGNNTLTGLFSAQAGTVVNTTNWVGNGRANQQVQVGGTDTAAVWTNSVPMTIGSGAAGISNTFTVATQGVLQVNGGIVVGTNAATYNALVVTNGAQVFSTAASTIGFTAASNAVRVTGGGDGTTFWNAGGQGLTVGTGTAIANVLTVDGAGAGGSAAVTNAGAVVIGNSSGSVSNRLVILNGGSFGSGSLTVGNAAGAINNSYNVGGLGAASYASNGTITVGNSANYNTMTATNGNLWSGALTIGAGASANNAVTVCSDATWNLQGNAIYIAATGNSAVSNSLTVNGGTVTNTSGISVSYGGNATVNHFYNSMTITNGGRVFVSGPVWVPNQQYSGTTRNHNFNSLYVADGGLLSSIGGGVGGNTSWSSGNYNILQVNGGGVGRTATWNLGGGEYLISSSGTCSYNALTINGAGVAGGAVVTNVNAVTLNGVGNSITLTNGAGMFSTSTVTIGNGSNSNTNTIVGGVADSIWNGGGAAVNIGSAAGSYNQLLIGAGGILTNAGTVSAGSGTCVGNQLTVINGGQLFAGNLRAGNHAGNADGNAVLIANGGTVNLTGAAYVGSITGWDYARTLRYNSLTITNGGQLFSSADSYIGSSVLNTSGYVCNNNNNTVTIDGSLSGTNSTWNLGGRNLYVGAVASGSTATGNVLTVTGGGVVTNLASLTVKATNSLSLGAGGRIYAGAATIAGMFTASLDDAVAPGCGRLTVTGNLNITGATLNIVTNGAPAGAAYVIASYGTLTGIFTGVSGMPDGYSVDPDYLGSKQIAIVSSADITPPTPDPVGWYMEPCATTNLSVVMVVSNASDIAGVQYLFTNTVNGNASGWIDGTSWTNSGLTHGVTCTYKVKARDKSSSFNETGWSPEKSATANRTILLYESFETPIVVGSSANATYSPGWAHDGGAQNYNGLFNEGTGLISTPYGKQVAKLWSGSLVKYSGLTNVLTAGTQYTVTFNAGNTDNGTPRSDNVCLVELLAGSTVLASASRTTTTDDMSTSGTFSFTPGSTHANLGQTVSVRIRMSGGNTSAFSLIDNLLLVGVPDTTPPTPDPMGFEVPPYGFSRSSIMMTASEATDATGPVQYQFTNDTAGISSGWSTNRVWQNTGLTPNNTYGYRVKARDAVLNETAWSAVAQSETSPPQPSVFRFR